MSTLDHFMAGAAQVDITPSLGTIIGVDFFSHYARNIHDKLYSKSIVFQQNGTQAAIVVVDICIMPSDLMATIKNEIESATHIKKENIMLSCTHTHGAGDVAGLLGGAVDIAYRTKIPNLITASVVKARERLKPAKIAYGSVDVPEHVLCRRYWMKSQYSPINPVTGASDQVKTNPIGVEHLIDRPVKHVVDPELGLLAIKDLNDRWISVLGNYCLHYVGDWDVDTITPDYYGNFAKLLQSKLEAGKDFVGMMSYGTGGDVNIWDFIHPNRYPSDYYQKTEMIAEDLSDRAIVFLNQAEWNSNPALRIAYSEFLLPVNKPSTEIIETAKEMLKNNRLNNLQMDSHGLKMIYAREQLLLDEYPAEHLTSTQIIRLGDLKIGASGAELFSETGLWLKEQIPGPYFTHCLTNTYDGYVVPAYQIELGGYETWRARSSFLKPGSEEIIRQKIVDLVRSVS
ncbi:MAG: neutral/alkaline non-lysosomal ceramidase N-terminal domain-containing protein [Saprospiraceae bacterium]|nr:neutral/alkaline non-lysosomal ceramidase N-terminal domain-containing protein [Saprospiraceae bacterium]